MILTLKPDNIQTGKIKKLMKYTDEKTATKAVMYAAVRYQNRLTDIEKLEKELAGARHQLQTIREEVLDHFQLKKDLKKNSKQLQLTVSRFPKFGSAR